MIYLYDRCAFFTKKSVPIFLSLCITIQYSNISFAEENGFLSLFGVDSYAYNRDFARYVTPYLKSISDFTSYVDEVKSKKLIMKEMSLNY